MFKKNKKKNSSIFFSPPFNRFDSKTFTVENRICVQERNQISLISVIREPRFYYNIIRNYFFIFFLFSKDFWGSLLCLRLFLLLSKDFFFQNIFHQICNNSIVPSLFQRKWPLILWKLYSWILYSLNNVNVCIEF